jgi:hypothetical protein
MRKILSEKQLKQLVRLIGPSAATRWVRILARARRARKRDGPQPAQGDHQGRPLSMPTPAVALTIRHHQRVGGIDGACLDIPVLI